MTLDETIRAFCYFIMFPAYTYFGLVNWNRAQRMRATANGLLSIFFFMLFLGLVLRHYYVPVPALLYLNTTVVVLLALATAWRATLIALAAFREWRAAKRSDGGKISQWSAR